MHKESSQVHGRCSVGITKGVVGSRDQNLKLEYLENERLTIEVQKFRT